MSESSEITKHSTNQEPEAVSPLLLETNPELYEQRIKKGREKLRSFLEKAPNQDERKQLVASVVETLFLGTYSLRARQLIPLGLIPNTFNKPQLDFSIVYGILASDELIRETFGEEPTFQEFSDLFPDNIEEFLNLDIFPHHDLEIPGLETAFDVNTECISAITFYLQEVIFSDFEAWLNKKVSTEAIITACLIGKIYGRFDDHPSAEHYKALVTRKLTEIGHLRKVPEFVAKLCVQTGESLGLKKLKAIWHEVFITKWTAQKRPEVAAPLSGQDRSKAQRQLYPQIHIPSRRSQQTAFSEEVQGNFDFSNQILSGRKFQKELDDIRTHYISQKVWNEIKIHKLSKKFLDAVMAIYSHSSSFDDVVDKVQLLQNDNFVDPVAKELVKELSICPPEQQVALLFYICVNFISQITNTYQQAVEKFQLIVLPKLHTHYDSFLNSTSLPPEELASEDFWDRYQAAVQPAHKRIEKFTVQDDGLISGENTQLKEKFKEQEIALHHALKKLKYSIKNLHWQRFEKTNIPTNFNTMYVILSTSLFITSLLGLSLENLNSSNLEEYPLLQVALTVTLLFASSAPHLYRNLVKIKDINQFYYSKVLRDIPTDFYNSVIELINSTNKEKIKTHVLITLLLLLLTLLIPQASKASQKAQEAGEQLSQHIQEYYEDFNSNTEEEDKLDSSQGRMVQEDSSGSDQGRVTQEETQIKEITENSSGKGAKEVLDYNENTFFSKEHEFFVMGDTTKPLFWVRNYCKLYIDEYGTTCTFFPMYSEYYDGSYDTTVQLFSSVKELYSQVQDVLQENSSYVARVSLDTSEDVVHVPEGYAVEAVLALPKRKSHSVSYSYSEIIAGEAKAYNNKFDRVDLKQLVIIYKPVPPEDQYLEDYYLQTYDFFSSADISVIPRKYFDIPPLVKVKPLITFLQSEIEQYNLETLPISQKEEIYRDSLTQIVEWLKSEGMEISEDGNQIKISVEQPVIATLQQLLATDDQGELKLKRMNSTYFNYLVALLAREVGIPVHILQGYSAYPAVGNSGYIVGEKSQFKSVLLYELSPNEVMDARKFNTFDPAEQFLSTLTTITVHEAANPLDEAVKKEELLNTTKNSAIISAILALVTSLGVVGVKRYKQESEQAKRDVGSELKIDIRQDLENLTDREVFAVWSLLASLMGVADLAGVQAENTTSNSGWLSYKHLKRDEQNRIQLLAPTPENAELLLNDMKEMLNSNKKTAFSVEERTTKIMKVVSSFEKSRFESFKKPLFAQAIVSKWFRDYFRDKDTVEKFKKDLDIMIAQFKDSSSLSSSEKKVRDIFYKFQEIFDIYSN